jgi:hypothetical protein
MLQIVVDLSEAERVVLLQYASILEKSIVLVLIRAACLRQRKASPLRYMELASEVERSIHMQRGVKEILIELAGNGFRPLA